MNDIKFNLLDEKWIRVRLPDNSIQEVSLTDVLINAHKYVDLAGETSTQDAAIFRLILSIPLTVFYRVDVGGKESSLTDSDEAIIRWQELWDRGSFPEKPIKDYAAEWHEKFWLIHPEEPFWQASTAEAKKNFNSKAETAKLNGEVYQSGNNKSTRILLSRTTDSANSLSYPEAARWLINLQSWDDNAVKPTTGVGWLAQIGYIQAMGRNLFETIMLNLTMLKDGQELWSTPIPWWEKTSRVAPKTKDVVANNFVDILTQPSRNLLLFDEGTMITGYQYKYRGGGYSFQTENNFSEQMTLWKTSDEKNGPIKYKPAKHDPAKSLWRNFSTIVGTTDNTHAPGIVQWVMFLQSLGVLGKERQGYFKTVGVQFNDDVLKCAITDVFDDTLSFRMDLLDKFSLPWRKRIAKEIEKCQSVAKDIGELCRKLSIARGFSCSGQSKKSLDMKCENVRSNFYFDIDGNIRYFIQTINSETDDIDEAMDKWESVCRRIAIKAEKSLIREAGNISVIARKVKVGNNKEKYYSAADAVNNFEHLLAYHYPRTEKRNE